MEQSDIYSSTISNLDQMSNHTNEDFQPWDAWVFENVFKEI